jgi:hypothetical protein
MTKKLTEVLNIKEDDSEKDKNKDGIDDDLQILHDCDEKEPVKEELQKTEPKDGEACPKGSHANANHIGVSDDVCESDKYTKMNENKFDLDIGTGRFNKRVKLSEQCGCGMDPMDDFSGISTNVIIPPPQDVFVAPPTEDEKNSILWSFSKAVATHISEMIASDIELKKVYGHEIPRKAAVMFDVVYNSILSNLEKA